ncbi:COP9/signalosome complex subunit Csn1 [Schizosaccharomyces cryophilus OY26]|uniref:COP9/signalosome complex subunit Csn1 n=1 Tax=Schizosaccharomyces cryophilus (strain OY26 / ATCC MYA-4695 / CBS 11777 / NBRC 106824 / NRRL Y48691) TaxID=653667 RepID=S9W6Q2_SCHCR|nr:COP9/signalosome complex subunit Csn1 [Schizosaccharomyces cryophilus OY26]EPY53545.1 COP9/signalosome complex subunit Csn1 [Schizosaccharomyces cryophilus OY26]
MDTADLEKYLNQYGVWPRIFRALFIARTHEAFRSFCSQYALKEIKAKTYNLELYTSVFSEFSNDFREEQFDLSWIDSVTYHRKQNLDHLTKELKSYKNNLIRESIRSAQLDLASFFADLGQFESALRAYAKVREYCTNAGQIAHLSLELMRVSIWMENYSHVLAFGSRAKSTLTAAVELKSTVYAYCGLAHMYLGDYKSALQHFIQVEPDFSDILLTKTDVSTYASLCALVCWDHNELIEQLNEDEIFNALSDLNPSLRKCMYFMGQRNYSSLFETLQTSFPEYALDMYLAPHLLTFMSLVRERSLVDYLFPYSAIPMKKIASDFHVDLSFIEDFLLQMVEAQKLDAKIDSLNKCVYMESSLEGERFQEIQNIAENTHIYSKAIHLQTMNTFNKTTDDESTTHT